MTSMGRSNESAEAYDRADAFTSTLILTAELLRPFGAVS